MKHTKTVLLLAVSLFFFQFGLATASEIVITDADSVWSPDLPMISYDVIDSADAPPQSLSEAYVSNADTVWSPVLERLESLTCSDGEKNGDETDVDCGGSCSPCDDGKSCLQNSDCMSGYCDESNVCFKSLDSTLGELSLAGRQLARTSDGVLHTVYYRLNGQYPQIYHSYSSDNGETWTEEPLTSESYNQTNPAIAVDSNNHLHVVWQGYHSGSPNHPQIRYRKYAGGWGNVINITTDTGWDQKDPAIAVDSEDNLHIVWEKSDYIGGPWCTLGCGPIYYSKYTSFWSEPRRIGEADEYGEVFPSIAIDSNDYLHVAWSAGGYHMGACWHSAYTRYTTSWQPVKSFECYACDPSIAVDSDGVVHYVSNYGAYSSGIKYWNRTASGWSDPEIIVSATSSTPRKRPSIALDSNDYLHVVWNDNGNIKYRNRTSDWQDTETIISDTDSNRAKLIWAYHPEVGGARTNMPKNGYAFVWEDGPTIKFYKSADLAWEGVSIPTCYDGEKNGDETDIDCGGSCSPCVDGNACHVDDDCLSGFCDEEICVAQNVCDNYADLGNADDESNHNLIGWGESSQGYPPASSGDDTKRYQNIRGENSLTLCVEQTDVPYLLTTEVEDDSCTDNFEVYVNGNGPVYSYESKNNDTITAETHQIAIASEYITGSEVEITFKNTAIDDCGKAAVYNVELTPLSTLPSSQADFEVGDTVEVYGTEGSPLAIRKTPGTIDKPESDVLKRVDDGTLLKVIGGPQFLEDDPYNYWWEVESDGIRGWSAENYLRKKSRISFDYNPQAAYDYAQKYWNKTCSDGYFFESSYPPDYVGPAKDIPCGLVCGFDCAHFVSSCIGNESNERGGGLNIPNRTLAYGEPGAKNLGNLLIENGFAEEKNSIDELEKGDVIIYNKSLQHHAVLYLGDGKIASHSASYWNESWDIYLGYGFAVHQYIHIYRQPNSPPNTPTNLQQFKCDETTNINIGDTTDESAVVFKANVNDPDGIKVKLQVELRRLDEYGGEFDETKEGLKESEFVESEDTAVIYTKESDFVNDGDYHWRARTIDEYGKTSEWVEFGNNDISDTDFRVSAATILPVPYYGQGTAKWCAPTSMSMVLKYYGKKKNVHSWDIAKEWGWDRNIQWWNLLDPSDDMIREYFNKNHNLITYEQSDIDVNSNTFNTIKSWIDEEMPVLLFIDGCDTEHMVVIVGYSDVDGVQKLYIHDPSTILRSLKELNIVAKGDMNIPVEWKNLKKCLGWRSYAIAVDGNPDSPKGTIDIDMSGYEGFYFSYNNMFSERMHNWAYGDDCGMGWDYNNHPSILNEKDQFRLDRYITNHMRDRQKYSLKIEFAKEGYMFSYYPISINIKGYERKENIMEFVSLQKLLGENSGEYTITLTLLDDNDKECDNIVFPNIIYLSTYLKKGDLMVAKLPNSPVPGYWSHVGIYVGEGWVVDANPKIGVTKTQIEQWLFPEKTWVTYLRVMTADDKTREKAVSFALDQVEKSKSFDYNWFEKQIEGESYYCSELAWAAYMHASDGSINIDEPDNFGGVSPSEIVDDENTLQIGGHFENEPETKILETFKGLRAILLCPSDLRVYDSQGRITGLVNGTVMEEIPNSFYNQDSKAVVIFNSTNSYRYEIAGTDDGTYGLHITLVEDENVTVFNATDIPTAPNVTHQYTINWTLLAQGARAVTIQIDSDGDGAFEQTVTAGSTFHIDKTNLTYTGNLSTQYSDPAHLSATITTESGDAVPDKIITFTLGSQTINATTDENGAATATIIINQIPDNYTIQTTFAGDDYYLSSADSDPFEILKEDTVLQTPNGQIIYSDDTNVMITLYDNDNQILSHQKDYPKLVYLEYFNGSEWINISEDILNSTDDSDATLDLYFEIPSDLDETVGNYDLRARFEGDDYYNPTVSDNGILTIVKEDTILSAPSATIVYSDSATVTVTMTDNENEEILHQEDELKTIYLEYLDATGRKTITKEKLSEGKVTFDFSIPQDLDEPPGIYPLGARFNGDNRYNPAQSMGTLTILKENVIITVQDKAGFTFENITLEAEIKDDDGNILLNNPHEVIFKVNNKHVGNSQIDENGKADILWNIDLIPQNPTEIHPIIVNFAGNEYYNEGESEGELTLKSPNWLKSSTIQKLESAKTDDKVLNKDIDLIIRDISKSLESELWIDASHLNPKDGTKVFHEEHTAVLLMDKNINRFKIQTHEQAREKQENGLNTNEEAKLDAINTVLSIFEEVTANLVKADELLAKISINDAKNTDNHQIKKAERELLEAYQELENERPAKAIKRFENAWKHAQLAIELFQKSMTD